MLYVAIAIAALAVGVVLGAPFTVGLLLRWERGRRGLPPEPLLATRPGPDRPALHGRARTPRKKR